MSAERAYPLEWPRRRRVVRLAKRPRNQSLCGQVGRRCQMARSWGGTAAFSGSQLRRARTFGAVSVPGKKEDGSR